MDAAGNDDGHRAMAGAGASGPDWMFQEAYRVHHAQLLRWVRYVTRDDAVAEEVTQEAFLRLLCEMRAGRGPENPGGWLHRVAANLVTSRARHARVAERRQGALHEPSWSVPVEASVLNREQALALCRALASMPADQRAILLLAARGLPGHEIATSIGVSDVALRTRLHRARTSLKLAIA